MDKHCRLLYEDVLFDSLLAKSITSFYRKSYSVLSRFSWLKRKKKTWKYLHFSNKESIKLFVDRNYAILRQNKIMYKTIERYGQQLSSYIHILNERNTQFNVRLNALILSSCVFKIEN